jgi:hypothetical protein
MEDHVVHESGQPHWESIAYEVDVVAALSKSFPEFGGDNTASAICWITRNANIHNEGSGCKFRQKWLKKQGVGDLEEKDVVRIEFFGPRRNQQADAVVRMANAYGLSRR